MRNKSKLLSWLLTFCMVVNMMPSMAFAEDVENSAVVMEENISSEENSQEDIVQVNANDSESAGDIVIMHTNDVHSRVDDNLGYTSVKGWKNHFEGNGSDVLLLDAGDTLHGLPIANLSNGSNIVKIMNEVGYDAMVSGNHDYNYGITRLLQLKNEMNFDLLVSNVTKDGVNPFTSSKIYLKSGKKIGVVGVATPETSTKTNPANVAGYKFNEDKLAQIVQGEINSLKTQGADYIVALGHLGLDDESAPYKSTDLIKDVTDIDIFVDGHSHSKLPNGMKATDKAGEEVLVVQTGDYAKEIGKVVIKQDGTITASLIKEKKEDAQTTALINKMKEDIKPLLDRVVGKTNVELNGKRDPGVRTKETNLANLVADALKGISGADVALTNGGGIRTSVDKGDITYGELNAVLPFGNVVTTIEVTGKQIVEALVHGTSSVPNASGAFPQVSGITYEIHAYETENRVQNVDINGKPVQLDKTYILATNDFTAAGGDGYSMLGAAKKIGEFGAMDEALISYIEKLPNKTVGEEYATEQGRIRIYLAKEDVPVIPELDEEEGGPTATGPSTGEETKPEIKPEPETKPEQGGNQGNGGNVTTPQTGDKNEIIAPIVISVVSIAILGAIVVNRKKIVQ